VSARPGINLALQGGGAHGAFTWGVLDRLLEDDGPEIAAISATSAGALNGAALKAGLLAGGRQGARDNLDWLWGQVGALPADAVTQWLAALSPDPKVISQMIDMSPAFNWADLMSRIVSPYGMPGDNPLRRIVDRFQWDLVCDACPPRLNICATNVRTGRIRIFTGTEICTQTILASACLPTLFRAVEWDDPKTGGREAFWDGGYIGNPALFPLIHDELPQDIVIVNINPLMREDVPKTARDIQNRINEISFNSSLLREVRSIWTLKRLLHNGALNTGRMREVYIHMISDDVLMTQLSVATKMVANPVILRRLKEAGRKAADRFLADHAGDLGQRDSVDMDAMFA